MQAKKLRKRFCSGNERQSRHIQLIHVLQVQTIPTLTTQTVHTVAVEIARYKIKKTIFLQQNYASKSVL
jgi:hypothetical protein